jgi:hypothetical protein
MAKPRVEGRCQQLSAPAIALVGPISAQATQNDDGPALNKEHGAVKGSTATAYGFQATAPLTVTEPTWLIPLPSVFAV